MLVVSRSLPMSSAFQRLLYSEPSSKLQIATAMLSSHGDLHASKFVLQLVKLAWRASFLGTNSPWPLDFGIYRNHEQSRWNPPVSWIPSSIDRAGFKALVVTEYNWFGARHDGFANVMLLLHRVEAVGGFNEKSRGCWWWISLEEALNFWDELNRSWLSPHCSWWLSSVMRNLSDSLSFFTLQYLSRSTEMGLFENQLLQKLMI